MKTPKETPQAIPRKVFDSIWHKWLDGYGQTKETMTAWWYDTGMTACKICEHTGGKSGKWRGKYCSLQNGKCPDKQCAEEFNAVIVAIRVNDHPAFQSACDAMLKAIANIPVIEDGEKIVQKGVWVFAGNIEEEKPFVDGQPVMWSGWIPDATSQTEEPQIGILKPFNGDIYDWTINGKDRGLWGINESSIRPLTAPELAEWNWEQQVIPIGKAKPKTPVYCEGDVVWCKHANQVITLAPKIKFGDWMVQHPDRTGGWIDNEGIRPLTEEEWINRIGEGENTVEFKAREDEYGNTCIICIDESILSIQHTTFLDGSRYSGTFANSFTKAIIKDFIIMPYEQWNRLREEKKGD